jgi:hypothetical protein
MKRASPAASTDTSGPEKGRRRVLITSALRGKILRALQTAGKWEGQRKGVKMKFSRAVQAELFAAEDLSFFDRSATVAWRAFAHGKWHQGNAGTVWDACHAIERL